MSRAGGPRWRRPALLAAAALVAGACAGGRAKSLDTEVLPPAFTYVAVGASETVGAGADDPATGSWPNVFYRTALARSATLVKVGMLGATVRQALDRELQPALAEQPRLVTVWLNVDDLVRQVPVEQYERDLSTLVHALRRSGANDVLVAMSTDKETAPHASDGGCRTNPGAQRPPTDRYEVTSGEPHPNESTGSRTPVARLQGRAPVLPYLGVISLPGPRPLPARRPIRHRRACRTRSERRRSGILLGWPSGSTSSSRPGTTSSRP